MRKLLYIIITLIILLAIGAWLKSQRTDTATTSVMTTEVEKQPVVTEDAEGNMTVDGEVVEDVEENMPEDTGGEEETTNNRMELTAVIEALSAVKRPVPMTIYLDSQYVKNGIDSWIAGWKRKGWRTASGQPVKNVDLWKKLDELVSTHDIDWQWVKGHAGEEGNEKADELANRGVPVKNR